MVIVGSTFSQVRGTNYDWYQNQCVSRLVYNVRRLYSQSDEDSEEEWEEQKSSWHPDKHEKVLINHWACVDTNKIVWCFGVSKAVHLGQEIKVKTSRRGVQFLVKLTGERTKALTLPLQLRTSFSSAALFGDSTLAQMDLGIAAFLQQNDWMVHNSTHIGGGRVAH